MAISDTLRGFRTQFLYTIHRVVIDCDSESYYIPEGQEDLDIKKNGQIVETIQIKNHKNTVIPSDLYSPSKSSSFYSRALSTVTTNKDAIIRLVSFSSLSLDLERSDSLRKYLNKNQNKDLKRNAKLIASAYKASIVDEDTLYEEIVTVLKTKFPSFNPDKELKYLLQWVYEKAEKSQGFTYSDVIKELICYQAFENKQACALKELGVRITPLFHDSLQLDGDLLRKGFYSGMSARAEHIALNLDVLRPEKLKSIEAAFQEQSVVIIKGASGQGKSTLAYRFIKDNYALAYEISCCNRSSLASLKATLSELCLGLSVPILLYFDAKPADEAWIDIVSTFSLVKNVRCLITLRNEDWNQYRRCLGCNALFKDIELTLQKEEAQQIYCHLCSENSQIIGAFEDVWAKFGKKSALLEFVYFVTQRQALKDKLVLQWNELQPDELKIVEKIIITNYFGGKINRWLDVLSEGASLAFVRKSIDKYLNEFFIEDDNGLLDSVHPLRTKILVESIFGTNNKAMNKKALELYFKSDIQDPHLFLLNLLKNGMQIKEIYDAAVSQPILTGSQFAGIVRAFIWKGTEEYMNNSRPHIDKIKEKVGGLWQFYLPVNFTEIDIKKSLNELLSTFTNVPDVTSIVESFPSQESIFCHLKKILDHKIDIALQSNVDWVIAADALYRLSLCDHISQIQLNGELMVEEFQVDELARILLGLKAMKLRKDYWTVLENRFVEKLRFEFLITNFVVTDSSIDATTFLRYTSDEESKGHKSADLSTNSHLVKIVDLLRMAFPEKNNYHVVLGHDAISAMAVDSEKNIEKVNLPLKPMQEIRSCIVNQYRNSVGCPNKSDYVESLLNIREGLVNANNKYINVFSKWWRCGIFDGSTYSESYQYVLSVEQELPHLSYISANIFGYGDFSSDEPQLTSWNLFEKKLTDYISDLSNFYVQAQKVLIKEESNNMPSKACLFDALFLIRELQKSFEEMFMAYIPDMKKYELLKQKEYDNLLSMWVIWETQCRNLKGITFTKQINRYSQMEYSLPRLVIRNIKEHFFQEGLISTSSISNKSLNIAVIYHNNEEYEKATQIIEPLMLDVFGKYETYTSQEYILRQNFDTIKVHFVYVDEASVYHRINSLAQIYDVRHLMSIGSNFDSTNYPLWIPEHISLNENNLIAYEEFLGLMSSMSIVGNQLSSMYQCVHEFDAIGMNVVKKYEEECIAECQKHHDSIRIFRTFLLQLNDVECYTDMISLINIIDKNLSNKDITKSIPNIDILMQEITKMDILLRIGIFKINSSC